MAMNYAMDNCQPNTGSIVFSKSMEALEDAEKPIVILYGAITKPFTFEKLAGVMGQII